MMHGFGTYGWGMGFGWLFGLVVLILIIWLVIRVVIQNNNTTHSNDKTALDILKERYARGEINKNEFEEMKKSIL